MTPDDLARAVGRGARAREILENELLVEAFDKTRERYIAEWEKAPARDTEGRERLWVLVRLLENVKDHLASVIDTGKLAQADLTAIREEEKRRGLWRLFG